VLIRLNKYLAQAGVASRREADELIQQGRVFINGEAVTSLGIKIDPDQDTVEVDGQKVAHKNQFIYVLLNKPPGYLVTRNDPFGRQTIYNLLPDFPVCIHPVGRLDAPSEGLLLLTNDGELAFRVAHPRYQLAKTYLVKVKGNLPKEALTRMKKGIYLDGRWTKPDKLLTIAEGRAQSVYLVEIHEGRKREIRRIFQAVGASIKQLKRVRLGPLKLGDLKKGQWRHLTPLEVQRLKKAVGLV